MARKLDEPGNVADPMGICKVGIQYLYGLEIGSKIRITRHLLKQTGTFRMADKTAML